MSTRRTSTIIFAGVLTVLASAGCADARQPPRVPASRPEPAQSSGGGASFTAQLGGMNQEAVEQSFARFQRDVLDCLREGSAQVEGLGGDLTLELRVAMDGRARWVHLSSSSLGHRATERCILGEAKARIWPKPKGGEGEISHTYSVEAQVPVHSWEPKRLRTAMAEIRKQTWKCLGGGGGRYEATLYIRRDGRVASAGVAPPRPQDDEKVDCLVDVLRTFQFGWQRPKITKVTFSLP